MGHFDIFPFVERAAGFLVRHSPGDGAGALGGGAGYSPSTLAAVISGLICAADIARDRGRANANSWKNTPTGLKPTSKTGRSPTMDVLLPGVKRHYMRIRPPECGEPYAHEGWTGNHPYQQSTARESKFDYEAREVVDAGFLELVRYGVRRADDPLVVDSLKVVDHLLKVETPVGPCWRRYNHDGYGQRADGGPFMGLGQGRAWPLLTGERGALRVGRRARCAALHHGARALQFHRRHAAGADLG